MKVVSVYKSGGDFNVKYVKAMHTALKRYMPCEYEFIVLTDKPEEVKQFATPILLKFELPKWWCKIELFDPKTFTEVFDPILYFDLDVLILKPMDDLIEVCESSLSPLFLRSVDPVGQDNNWPSSSIMSWRGSDMHIIWKEFFKLGKDVVFERMNENISRAGQRTDQGFIRTLINPILKLQDVLPDNYVLFKRNYYQFPDLFEKATILNWTGKPRFANMREPFGHIRKIWEERIKCFT